MGASAWHYVTKWEPDLNAALARAQEETLRAGSYGLPRRQVNLPRNATVEDVRDAYAEAGGSASVLDVRAIESEPGPEVAGPFSEDVMLDLFGTLKPTRPAVMGKLWEILELVGRGETACVVMYEAGDPKEILFAGYTAD